MKKPKARKQHKRGTFELWFSIGGNGKTNFFIVKEDGKTEFMFSDGLWDDLDWNRREYNWFTRFEFAGYL